MKYPSPYIVILIIGLVFLSCTKAKQVDRDLPSEPKENIAQSDDLLIISKDQFENEGLSMTSIKQHNFGSKITSTGILEVPPTGRAVISAQIGGYIKSSPLLIGDHVEKGQLLVSIENIAFIELQQEYLEAKEQLVFLKSDYERQEELFNEKITSEKSYLKAQSNYHKTLATSKGLIKKLQLLNIDPKSVEAGNLSSVARIYAPISGDVTEIDVKTGSHVTPEEEIMEIVNTDHMHLELKIFVQDVLKIKKGQTVLFKLPESHTKSFEGKVHLIGKSIQADRTVKVHVHLKDSDSEGFVPGMYVQATILADEVSSPAIEEDALIQLDEQHYLLKLNSENEKEFQFEKFMVLPGDKDDDMIMIKTEEPIDFKAKFLRNTSRFAGF